MVSMSNLKAGCSSLSRRKITVFSANMAAFTIDHGESESTGPDLLVSFHDNDHYNSVRNMDEPNPKPPPQRRKDPKQAKKKSKSDSSVDSENVSGTTETTSGTDTTASTTTSLSELSVEDTKEKVAATPVKKGAPCPCGSGRKYKKCCLAKEKHAARIEKMQSEKSSDCAAEDEDEDVVMKGNFRVLQI